jgi:GNAT superfamily N-acetyltransferase
MTQRLRAARLECAHILNLRSNGVANGRARRGERTMTTPLDIIDVNAENLAAESVCCGFSDKKHRQGVQDKEAWLRARFAEGLTYKKLNVRCKVFIEYIPAEYAWAPVEAPNYLFIHCLWVSGKYKGQGWSRKLLAACEQDAVADGKHGLAVISTQKKKPFTVEKKFFLHHGFEVCDCAPPYFELLVKRCQPDAPLPVFRDSARQAACDQKNGFVFMYSDQCPYLDYWVEQMIGFAGQRSIPASKLRLTTRDQARNMPSAYPLFSMFYNGQFITHEMMPEKKFDALIASLAG